MPGPFFSTTGTQIKRNKNEIGEDRTPPLLVLIFVSILLSHYEQDKNTKPRPEGGDQVPETDDIR